MTLYKMISSDRFQESDTYEIVELKLSSASDGALWRVRDGLMDEGWHQTRDVALKAINPVTGKAAQ